MTPTENTGTALLRIGRVSVPLSLPKGATLADLSVHVADAARRLNEPIDRVDVIFAQG